MRRTKGIHFCLKPHLSIRMNKKWLKTKSLTDRFCQNKNQRLGIALSSALQKAEKGCSSWGPARGLVLLKSRRLAQGRAACAAEPPFMHWHCSRAPCCRSTLKLLASSYITIYLYAYHTPFTFKVKCKAKRNSFLPAQLHLYQGLLSG